MGRSPGRFRSSFTKVSGALGVSFHLVTLFKKTLRTGRMPDATVPWTFNLNFLFR